jgi:6,7-dimethyl-8-ribityllumazine synthase
MRFAAVISEFNLEVTGGLLAGARRALAEEDEVLAEEDVFAVPGAFEIPLVARTLARTGRYDGVICLGCVIKGETAHFEYISLAATMGILQTNLDCDMPVSFGVLTTYTEEQAAARSGSEGDNKGVEAALACVKTARLLRRIRGVDRP